MQAIEPTKPDAIVAESIALSESWLSRGNRIKSKRQIAFDRKIAKMVSNPDNKHFLTELIDQSFRPTEAKRTADQIDYLLRKYRNIDLFDASEAFLIKLFTTVGRHVPQISVPAIISRIRNDTSEVILDGDRAALADHIEKRRTDSFRVNLNIIGEALLGEKEAQDRVEIYQEALARPEVNYISIKISTIYSQISSLAFQETVAVLTQRLSVIYRDAIRHATVDATGERTAKFVNLDMEEYRDLALTVSAFKNTLDQPEFKHLSAGIVLQTYLPDCLAWLEELTEWAIARVQAGGAPIKVRLVKGANMDMEKTEASQRHWPLATYHDKLDTDANYRRAVRYALQPERVKAVHIGIASHNLFELAHAHLLAKKTGTSAQVVFEMLEGMADATARTLHADGIPVLLYAPVATRENFAHAIAYYVRRLDENTSPQNFLTHSFDLQPGNEQWNALAQQFRDSFDRIQTAAAIPFRTQSRLHEDPRAEHHGNDGRFHPEPDTDWTQPDNRAWAQSIIKRWKHETPPAELLSIPIVVGESALFEEREHLVILDQSQHDKNIPLAHYALATIEDIDNAMAIARSDQSDWRKRSHEERSAIMARVANKLREKRGDLLGVAAAEVGKLLAETDVEVSEAIDFVEFYPLSVQKFAARKNLKLSGKGVGLIIPPWNFPIAIPTGGIAASLAAGNNVILKPSPQATYCSWLICEAFWQAGVPKSALQFLPCRNKPEAAYLASHSSVDYIIFTGSTQTALAIQQARPRLNLYAETGGKNAMIVSAVADRDKAIADITQSAYGNSGQKCSAASLLLLHRSLFDDPTFKEALIDAAQSLPIGSAWDLDSKLGPLTNPVGGNLEKALHDLTPDEYWALEPERSAHNPHLLSPGILWNLSRESYCYRNELFGPVLGVMPYDTLEEAIRLVNGTDYGLTSGLHTLDDREITEWKEGTRAGNLYINRGITGAIVLRQPFGGMAKSAIGPGIKAGGWNYALEFTDTEELAFPQDRISAGPLLETFTHLLESFPQTIGDSTKGQLRAAFESSLYEHEHVFSQSEDYFQVRGESNQSRYLKMSSLMVRIEPDDSTFSIFMRLFHSLLSGTKLFVSASPKIPAAVRKWLATTTAELKATYSEEEQTAIVPRLSDFERIRFASPAALDAPLAEAAAEQGIYLATSPPLMDARLELTLYFREQCISHSYHRYGNLGSRSE
jgi:RHH-type proline utilization regulon transcriptional repressor/proline dehydrogenase/delta 1-pyrroline-5-carboxylate dehydrogenase